MERLLKVLHEVRPDIDFAACDDLVMGGRIESIDIVQIMAAISEEYDIDIPPREIKMKNFNSAQAILEMIERVLQQQ